MLDKALAAYKTLGILFVCLLLFGVWLTYAVFTKKFADYEEVKLETTSVGLQLPTRADVKIRGVLVGEVLEADIGDQGAELNARHLPGPAREHPGQRQRRDHPQDALRREVRLSRHPRERS